MKKNMFDRTIQRFSLRKYSFGVASVLLGTFFLGTAQVSANEVVEASATEAIASSVIPEIEDNKDEEEVSSTETTSEASTTQVDKTSDEATGKKTVGYKVNAVETPKTASMPRREGYVGEVGTTLRAADPKDANDKMPADSELTDVTKFAVVRDPEAPENLKVAAQDQNLAGNVVTPAEIPADYAKLKETNDKLRIAMIWAVSDKAGQNNYRYYSLVNNTETDRYQIKEYDLNKNLLATYEVASNGSTTIKPYGDGEDKATITLTDEGSNGTNVKFNRAKEWKTTNKYDVKRVYSAILSPVIPDSYKGENGNPLDSIEQSLVYASEVKVNYLVRGTKEQVADSNILKGFVGDKYKTVAATEAEFYENMKGKGYELVQSPTYVEGTFNGTYWGGKGFVAVRDVTINTSYQDGYQEAVPVRVRLTVVSENGDVTFEMWNKNTGQKFPIQYLKEDPNNPTPTVDYNGKPAADRVYITPPIRPADRALKSNEALYQVAFDMGFYGNHGVFNSTWTSGWRPAAAELTYWYDKTQADVDVKYINTDGVEIKASQKVVDDAKIGSNYDATTSTLKPSEIEATDGTKYYLVSKEGTTKTNVKYDATGTATGEGNAPATGSVTKEDQTVTYVYEKAGNVNINYISTDGTVIKAPVKDTVNGKPGENYNAAEGEEKPATINFNGKEYRLVTAAGTTTGSTPKSYGADAVATGTDDSPATGTVESGVTKEVTYVYEEVVKDDTARIIYQHTDKTGNTVVKELEKSEEITGKKDEDVNYSTEDTIKKYQKLG